MGTLVCDDTQSSFFTFIYLGLLFREPSNDPSHGSDSFYLVICCEWFLIHLVRHHCGFVTVANGSIYLLSRWYELFVLKAPAKNLKMMGCDDRCYAFCTWQMLFVDHFIGLFQPFPYWLPKHAGSANVKW